MEDKKLIKKCQCGDKDAFEKLISIYHPYVYKFLIKLTEDEDAAEDLVQEVFIKVIKNIDKFDLNGRAKFSTYIITISKNLYIDYLRKNRKYIQNINAEEIADIEDINTNIEQDVIDKMDGSEVMKNMNNLTVEQRTAIKLKYVEGLTLNEIGDMIGVEPKTVKSRIHNGIVKLRKLLGK